MKFIDKLFNNQNQFETTDEVLENLQEKVPELSNDERMSLRNSHAYGQLNLDRLAFDTNYDIKNSDPYANSTKIKRNAYEANRENMIKGATKHSDIGYNRVRTYPDTDHIYNTNGIIENSNTKAVTKAIDRMATLETEKEFDDVKDNESAEAYNQNYLKALDKVANVYDKKALHQHDDEITNDTGENVEIPDDGPIAVTAKFNQRDTHAHSYVGYKGNRYEYPSYLKNEGVARNELRNEYQDELSDVNPQIRIDNVRDGYGTMTATFIFDNKEDYNKWNEYTNAGDDDMNTVRDINKIDQSEFKRLNPEETLDLKNGLDDLSKKADQQL